MFLEGRMCLVAGLLWLTILLGQGISPIVAPRQMNSADGTWKGNMKIAWNGDIHSTPYTIIGSWNISGTFEGAARGEWLGEYYAKYGIYPLGIRDAGIGRIKGNYTMDIDDSGQILGEGAARITGMFQGELKFQIQGVESESGYLNGTWSGVSSIESFNSKGAQIQIEVGLPVSGEFKGTAQRLESTMTTTQTPIPPTSTTPAQPTPPTPMSSLKDQYLPYVIAVIVTVVLAGLYAIRVRRVRRE